MLRISLQTLRARRGSLAGAFVAIFLAVSSPTPPACSWRERSAPPAPAVLRPPTRSCAPIPPSPSGAAIPSRSTSSPARACRPRPLPAPRRCPAWPPPSVTCRSRSAPRCARPASSALQGHGWASAALTPYRLTSGHAPSGPRDVVVDSRLHARLGATLHITAPGGEGTYRVSGIARGAANRDRGQAAVFFSGATADTLSGAPGRVNAVGIIAKPGASLAGLRPPGRRRARPRPRGRRRRGRPAGVRPRGDGRDLRHAWAASPASSRCSWSPGRSRSRSPSGARRPRCCARSAPRRARSAA